MINLKTVSKKYVDFYALKDITFKLEKGDFLLVTGKTGTGKSTLLRLLYGDIKDFYGDITIGGIKLNEIDRKKLQFLRRKVGVIFQDFKLLNDRSVFENILISFYALNKIERKDLEHVRNLMREFDVWKYKDYMPCQISGGEQQKVGIVRALCFNPWIVIADEPTGNLDPESSKKVFEYFKKVSSKGITVVLATHDESLAKLHEGRLIKLKDGSIV
jgi:cell division transport system ATP-binding protein